MSRHAGERGFDPGAVMIYACPPDTWGQPYDWPTVDLSPIVVSPVVLPGITPEECRRIVREELERWAREQAGESVADDTEYTCPPCWVRQ